MWGKRKRQSTVFLSSTPTAPSPQMFAVARVRPALKLWEEDSPGILCRRVKGTSFLSDLCRSQQSEAKATPRHYNVGYEIYS